jgi:hypothetical protein
LRSIGRTGSIVVNRPVIIHPQPRPTEQRIGYLPEVAHQRTEPAPLDQPVKGIRIPLATGLPYERLEVAGAADRDQGAEIAELARADDGRD